LAAGKKPEERWRSRWGKFRVLELHSGGVRLQRYTGRKAPFALLEQQHLSDFSFHNHDICSHGQGTGIVEK